MKRTPAPPRIVRGKEGRFAASKNTHSPSRMAGATRPASPAPTGGATTAGNRSDRSLGVRLRRAIDPSERTRARARTPSHLTSNDHLGPAGSTSGSGGPLASMGATCAHSCSTASSSTTAP